MTCERRFSMPPEGESPWSPRAALNVRMGGRGSRGAAFWLRNRLGRSLALPTFVFRTPTQFFLSRHVEKRLATGNGTPADMSPNASGVEMKSSHPEMKWSGQEMKAPHPVGKLSRQEMKRLRTCREGSSRVGKSSRPVAKPSISCPDASISTPDGFISGNESGSGGSKRISR